MTGRTVSAVAPDGVPEVRPGDDLVGLLLPLVDLADGDVVVVTSKVVSKAEGRLVAGDDREAAIEAEAVRVVARRGPTTIVRTSHGLTMAAAGVWTVGLDGDAEQLLFGLELATEPVALVLGAEGSGLSRLVRDRCDVLAAIPQQGSLASLNVGAAGAIACFEVARRRML